MVKSSKNKELTKDEQIKREINKLKKIYSELDEKTKKITISLIENAAFMVITLKELQEQIKINGTVSEYQNGENQWGTKKSPEIEIYNTMIKNHMSIIKQLTDLLPKNSDKKKEVDDGFLEFVYGREDV